MGKAAALVVENRAGSVDRFVEICTKHFMRGADLSQECAVFVV